MPDLTTAGEILVKRELRKEKRAGVEHYVTGQHVAKRVEPGGPGVEMAAELSYVDVMGHAVLVECVYHDGGWTPVVLARAGQVHAYPPCLASKAGFELSEKMVETLREIE